MFEQPLTVKKVTVISRAALYGIIVMTVDGQHIMRLLPVLGFVFLWPAQSMAITYDEARHLLARTGFGVAEPADIQKLLPMSFEQAVDHLLDGVRTEPVTAVPEFAADPTERRKVRRMNAENRRDFNKRVNGDRKAMKAWWVGEMLVTDSPLTEHLVLFWHNHFVSEARKVRFGQWIYAQNAIFRKYALGNFGKMLVKVSTDPAMLWYLDGHKNVKGKPNENFAREVLELFSMGEGRGYTEKDIREAARAFTGWTVDIDTGKFDFKFGRHDHHIKTVLGVDGNHDGMSVLRIILRRNEVAEFITEKLWLEFVSREPDPRTVRELAGGFRDSGYELKPLLRSLLLTDAFRDPANRGILVKSPVDLVIGTLRLFHFEEAPAIKAFWWQKNMGQELFDPPDVKGWRGHTAWLSSTTALRREQFIRAVHRGLRAGWAAQNGRMMKAGPFGAANAETLQAALKSEWRRLPGFLLAAAPVMQRPANGKGMKRLANLTLDPVYQLK